MKTIKTLSLIVLLLAIITTSCTTPRHIVSPKTVKEQKPTNQKSNIKTFSVIPLTKKDKTDSLDLLQNSFESYLWANESIRQIRRKYPDFYFDVIIHASETKKRTWILDIPFFYPYTLIWPLTPWWGKTMLNMDLNAVIPNLDRAPFKFTVSKKYFILLYPYYFAGSSITKSYKKTYQILFNNVLNYDFCANWNGKNICSEQNITEKYAYKQTISTNITDANRNFIEEHPELEKKQKNKLLLDSINRANEDLLSVDSAETYQNSQYTEEAKIELNSLAASDFEKAKFVNTYYSYSEFIKKYPNSDYTNIANTLLKLVKKPESKLISVLKVDYDNIKTPKIDTVYYKYRNSLNITQPRLNTISIKEGLEKIILISVQFASTNYTKDIIKVNDIYVSYNKVDNTGQVRDTKKKMIGLSVNNRVFYDLAYTIIDGEISETMNNTTISWTKTKSTEFVKITPPTKILTFAFLIDNKFDGKLYLHLDNNNRILFTHNENNFEH